MNSERCIIIGCDDKSVLSFILKQIHKITSFSSNVISISRVTDLINIADSIIPDLIILSFQDTQNALDDCIRYIKKTEIPILCLIKNHEINALTWNINNIVFTCPFEIAGQDKLFVSRMQSIFLLKNKSVENVKTSLAETAINNSGAGNLSRYVMELDQKIELLSKLKTRISELYPRVDDVVRKELISITSAIKFSLSDSKLWNDFKLYFEQTNPGFLFLLSQKHPNLTSKDLKYCCYVKMNMTNDDIRNLLGINQESVRTHKHRLKKKMTIPKDQDLRSYLLSLSK